MKHLVFLLLALTSASAARADCLQDHQQEIEAVKTYFKMFLENTQNPPEVALYNIEQPFRQALALMKKCSAAGWKDFGISEADLEKRIREPARALLEKTWELSEKEGRHLPSQFERYGFLSGKSGEAGYEKKLQQLRSVEKQKKEGCGGVDLRPKLPPVKNQDSIGWCYGFAAADMVSFKTGKDVSGVDASLLYEGIYDASLVEALLGMGTDESGNLSVTAQEGGLVSAAAEKLLDRGYCSEADLPSPDLENAKAFEKAVKASKALKMTKSADDRLKATYQYFESLAENSAEIDCQEAQGKLKDFFPGLDLKQLMEILDRSHRLDVIKNLAEESCKPRKAVSPRFALEDFKWPFTSSESMAQILHAQLDRGQISAIGYNPKVLFGQDPGDIFDARHASTVVGRRWNAARGSCEFLVRNTWGSACIYPLDCEEGNVWVGEKALSQSVFDLSVFKN